MAAVRKRRPGYLTPSPLGLDLLERLLGRSTPRRSQAGATGR